MQIAEYPGSKEAEVYTRMLPVLERYGFDVFVRHVGGTRETYVRAIDPGLTVCLRLYREHYNDPIEALVFRGGITDPDTGEHDGGELIGKAWNSAGLRSIIASELTFHHTPSPGEVTVSDNGFVRKAHCTICDVPIRSLDLSFGDDPEGPDGFDAWSH